MKFKPHSALNRLDVERWKAEGENASARLELANIQVRMATVINQGEPLAARLAALGFDYGTERRDGIRTLIEDTVFFVAIGRWPEPAEA